MAIGKKSKKPTSSKKPKADWRNILSVCQTEDERQYCKAGNYKGRLIWEDFNGEDEPNENSKFFVIKSANIFDPGDKDPDFIVAKVVVNLKNEKSVELMTENADDEDASED